MNYRFAYFYIVFILIINLFVGYYDNSLQKDMDTNINDGQTYGSITWNSITFFLKVVFFGIFSDVIPFALSFILWIPAGMLFLIGLIDIVVKIFDLIPTT